MIDWLVRLVIRGRLWVLLAVALLVCAAIAVLPRLKYEQDVLYLFRTSKSEQRMEAEENALLVLVGSEDCLEPDIIRRVRSFAKACKEIESVGQVLSLVDARRPVRVRSLFLPVFPTDLDDEQKMLAVRERAAVHPLLQNHLLSRDNKWTQIVIRLKRLKDSAQLDEAVTRIQALARQVFETSRARFYVTGLPAVQMQIQRSLRQDQRLFISGGVLVGFLVSLLIFRNWRSVAIVMAGPLVGAIWIFGLIAFIGEPVNPLNVVVIPMSLTIAMTDSVHLQIQIDRLRDSGSDLVGAVEQAMREVGPACVLTSVTTMIGFGSLYTAHLVTIRRFGIICGVSVALSLLAVMILIPAVSVVLGPGAAIRSRRQQTTLDREFFALGAFSVKHRRLIVALSFAVLLVMLAVATRLAPSISLAEGLPRASDAQVSVEIADANFGGTFPLKATVAWDPRQPPTAQRILEAMREVEMLFKDDPVFSEPLSLADLIRTLPDQDIGELSYVPDEFLGQFLDPQEGVAFVTTWLPDAGSKVLAPRLKRFDEQLDALRTRYGEFSLSYNERDFAPLHLGDTLILDLAFSLVTATVLCTLVIGVGLRSFRLGLVAVPPNCLPLAATACLMVMFDMPLQLTSVTVFAIALGVAVDDTIHLLQRYQLQHIAPRDGRVIEALVHVARPICLTTFILVCGLSVVLFSQIPAIQQFGSLFISALAWALVGDLFMLPSFLRMGAPGKSIQSRP